MRIGSERQAGERGGWCLFSRISFTFSFLFLFFLSFFLSGFFGRRLAFALTCFVLCWAGTDEGAGMWLDTRRWAEARDFYVKNFFSSFGAPPLPVLSLPSPMLTDPTSPYKQLVSHPPLRVYYKELS